MEDPLGTAAVTSSTEVERATARALAEQFGLEYVDLSRRIPEPGAVSLLPEGVARANWVVPVSFSGGVLTVAVAQPTETLRGRLTNAIQRPVRMAVAAATDIQRSLDSTYRVLGAIAAEVQAFHTLEAGRRATDVPAQRAPATPGETPVGRIFDLLILQALRDGASDIHLEPQPQWARVRFRIDGTLQEVVRLPIEIVPTLASRIKVLSEMDVVERRKPQDGQVTMTLQGRDLDIRVSMVSTLWGESCVLRLLDRHRPVMQMSDLGMPEDARARFVRHVFAPYGMVLCAGPTGSGKTTTLYTALHELDQPGRNIMTIEDPVEYLFPTMNQIQTSELNGLTFATGLRSILRQDPDVILVGEIRDIETARIAIQSAQTGHMVMSTLHATHAAAALHRFLDMGIESFLVASSVTMVVSQRLVRRVCDSCRVSYNPMPEDLAFFDQTGASRPARFWAGAGCNFCGGTGYRGRVGVFEVMSVSPEIKDMILNRAATTDIRAMAVSQGMRTLQDEAIRLVAAGVTSIPEVMRTIYAV